MLKLKSLPSSILTDLVLPFNVFHVTLHPKGNTVFSWLKP